MLYGAIIGDICGSVYEGYLPCSDAELFDDGCTFTDDTVCTCAIANALLTDGDFGSSLRDICSRYPDRGYGAGFRNWFTNQRIGMSDSFGNGAIMRISPVAWAYNNIRDILTAARASVSNSHNNRESIRAAEAISKSIYLARTGCTKDGVLDALKDYGYKSNDILTNEFQITCQGTVPIIMSIFEKSNSFEECILNAIRGGGDTDTNAAIVGSIAEAYYGIPQELIDKARLYLEPDLLEIVDKFESVFSKKLQSL